GVRRVRHPLGERAARRPVRSDDERILAAVARSTPRSSAFVPRLRARFRRARPRLGRGGRRARAYRTRGSARRRAVEATLRDRAAARATHGEGALVGEERRRTIYRRDTP